MAESGGLENRCTRKGTVGSNPTLSAISLLKLLSAPSKGRTVVMVNFCDDLRQVLRVRLNVLWLKNTRAGVMER